MGLDLNMPPIDPALKRRITHCAGLPSPPAVALRIIDLGEDPFANLEQVAEVIRIDPALAARILRMANSPMYARRHPAETLQQAVMRIGLSGTLSLALSFSMVTASRGANSQRLDLNRFWVRGVATACAAKQICAQVDRGQSDQAFLAGLFADIGTLVLDKVAPDLYQGLDPATQTHAALTAAEIDQLGCDHTLVGAYILGRWKLPAELVQAVAHSHGGQTDESQDATLLSRCVTLAGHIAALCIGDATDQQTLQAAQMAQEMFAIDSDGFSELTAQTTEMSREMADDFGIDLSDGLLLEGIAEQAKEILLLRNLDSIRQSEALKSANASLETRTEVLEHEASRDGLTGTFNRSHFDSALKAAFAEAQRSGLPLAIAFVDLDRFKQVNDTYGHQVGDAVLQHSAGLLNGLSRPQDCVARYGGEEFVLILPNTDASTAIAHCEQLLKVTRNSPVILGSGHPLHVTASIGLSIHGGDTHFSSAMELVQAADTAMYQAKHSGRDRLACHRLQAVSEPV